MVATLGSEPGIRDGVWIRLPSSAQGYRSLTIWKLFAGVAQLVEC